MPWEVTDPMREREKFVVDVCSGLYTVVELAERYGVSRKTLYKWLNRYEAEGLSGLEDRSRAPGSCPHQTPAELEAEIVAYRRRFPLMGPKKIITRLSDRSPHLAWPSPSTAGDILNRHELIERPYKRRGPPQHPRSNSVKADGPNDVMTLDFKGQFRLGNRMVCYPLTAMDLNSRFLMSCQALGSNQLEPTRLALERLFHTYGLPRAIRSDNGSPFGSPGLGRLSKLSLWFMRLGIEIQRITPGHPEQNGAHERMHKTLKRHTARPPRSSMRAQQQAFDEFRHFYNEERPHEALGQKRPTSLYCPSSRPLPDKLPKLEFPGHTEIRKVDHKGQVKFRIDHQFANVLPMYPV
jgi:transposase InsO family protein